jgi:hypothetical protein
VSVKNINLEHLNSKGLEIIAIILGYLVTPLNK